MNTPHQEPSDAAAASASAAPALGPDELDEIDTLLDDLRTRGEEIPQWEFCDGFLTALICSRRPIPPSEYLPMLLGDGAAIDLAEDEPLPLLPAFADAAQQARFMELWMLRWNEVEAQLDAPVEKLDDDRTFQPEAMDMRGAVASLPEDQRAEMAGQEIPSFGQVWALGFMFAVENWPEDWAAPRDKEAAKWLDDALDSIVALTEDDTGKPEVCMFSEDGPPSTARRAWKPSAKPSGPCTTCASCGKAWARASKPCASWPNLVAMSLAGAAAARSSRSATAREYVLLKKELLALSRQGLEAYSA